MSANILIVDDEDRYLRLMECNLAAEGYNVLKASNGQEAVDIAVKEHPDLILLDIRMPVLDGFSACERIREFSSVPIIMVTVFGKEIDRVHGFDLGADDYIVKPFSVNELLARVRAVLRRVQSQGTTFQQGTFVHGNLRIDYTRAEVFRDDNPIYLSATEYRLLLQFARNVGNVLTAEQLLEDVWGSKYRDDKEIFWVCISRMRQKLETDPKHPQHIVTSSGLGYSMPLIQT